MILLDYYYYHHSTALLLPVHVAVYLHRVGLGRWVHPGSSERHFKWAHARTAVLGQPEEGLPSPSPGATG